MCSSDLDDIVHLLEEAVRELVDSDEGVGLNAKDVADSVFKALGIKLWGDVSKRWKRKRGKMENERKETAKRAKRREKTQKYSFDAFFATKKHKNRTLPSTKRSINSSKKLYHPFSGCSSAHYISINPHKNLINVRSLCWRPRLRAAVLRRRAPCGLSLSCSPSCLTMPRREYKK